ncbi:ferritin-like domain-containing protein [Dioszegia hungarica]|uniref:Ferritin-like domain-containing protein n=1 Tax=Dioszegia hungarica TaxID=4972 RepID=A0AA38HA28_9TREE|nr:ferritin-like domain-containing protein [Dioszegia hungarica]KAI9635304.1 ferritin-like domain-containing protein [Dioszegia hungarica]
MKFAAVASLLAAGVAVASPVVSNPLKRAAAVTDLQVLQYALTLEHLEAAYYAQGLAKFNYDDFAKAGFPDWVRGRVLEISQHESSHVKLLTAALGNNSVPACQYAFPLTDPRTFISFASFLENIGVSAYIGANQYISDPLYATVAGSILAVEARHQGFFSGPVLTQADWTGPYDTPLGLDMVYTLAAQLITSCPAGPSLPVTASSPLALAAGLPVGLATGGSAVALTYAKSSSSVPGPVNAVLYNGLGSVFLPYTDGKVTIPKEIQGFSYVILTNAADAASVTTANTVAGPAVINTPFDAFQSNAGFKNPFGA